MDRMDYREGCEVLRNVGCTALEIEQLSELRRNYSEPGKYYRRIVAYSSPRYESWFMRVLRKIASSYFSSTLPTNMYWPNDHFLW